MAASDRIQFYRKQLGLSQEELGEALLVSKQTVDAWEKGKAVPTLDNLIHFKELFGISIDEILDCNHIQEDTVPPSEAYWFHYSNDDLTELYRYLKKRMFKRPVVIFVVSLLVLIFVTCVYDSKPLIAFLFGVILIGAVAQIKGLAVYRKTWNERRGKITQSAYEYRVYSDYMIITIHRNGETVRTSKVYFQEIEQVLDAGKYLLFAFSGQAFILRKSELPDNAAFYTFLENHPQKTALKAPRDKWSGWSLILFVGSLLSLFGALLLVFAVSGVNHVLTENMWMCFLLTPIPIASTVFGIVLKNKGKHYRYKKNIVAGIIITVLLCLYGSFSFLFANVYDHSDAPVSRLEQYAEIDLPDYQQINTQDWTKGTQLIAGDAVCFYYTSDIYFAAQEAEQLKTRLASDPKWISSLPNDMIGILPPYSPIQKDDYVFNFNMDDGTYGQLPATSGTYHFFCACYRAGQKQMRITEYTVDYVKEGAPRGGTV